MNADLLIQKPFCLLTSAFGIRRQFTPMNADVVSFLVTKLL
jgi:hypothetical protein